MAAEAPVEDTTTGEASHLTLDSEWEVVGGADRGGIVVRTGKDIKSVAAAERLSTGAVVKELEHDAAAGRLHYQLLTGTGPAIGWVSVRVQGKELMVRKAKEEKEKGGDEAAEDTSGVGEGAISARRRDQPALAELLERLTTGAGQGGPGNGVADGVSVSWLDADASSHEEPSARPWAAWQDPWQEMQDRGGANVFSPAEQRDGACLLWIHGGSFQAETPWDPIRTSFCSRLAVQTQLVVVSPDHLLAGEGRPFHAREILLQLAQDVLSLRDHDPVTRDARPAPARVFLGGDSTGGTQAFSLLLLLAAEQAELLECIPGVVMVSPCLDLTCQSHTYISNAFSEELQTGDVFMRESVDANRENYRNIAKTYTGSEELLTDCTYSPYWLSRGKDEQLLCKLEAAHVPVWMCVGAAETLSGEVLDFTERLRERLHLEVWLHEAVFHAWVMHTTDNDFPSRNVAMQHLADFVQRTAGNQDNGSTPDLYEGIHYFIDEW